jgi:hypothetical protein
MALGKHQRTAKGTFRKERDDSQIKNLVKEYPILEQLHGNIKTLGGAKKSLGVNSLDQVLKTLRSQKTT